jgi:hypothetical protein
VEGHPGVRLAEQARRRVKHKAKAQGFLLAPLPNSGKKGGGTGANDARARRLPRRRSAAVAAAATKGEGAHQPVPIHSSSRSGVVGYTRALLASLLARLLPQQATAAGVRTVRRLQSSAEPALQRLRLDALVWKLALPAMAALALEPAMHFADTVYLSRRLGPTCLAAFALGERAVGLASLLFAAALSTPITPFVARLRAEGSARLAYALVVRRLAPACALLGLALIPLLNAAGVPLLRLLGVGKEALAPALEYYRIRVAGVPAILLNALAVGVFRCVAF